MSSAEVSSFSAQAPPSSIDPRRLQQPSSKDTSSEEHDSFKDLLDQSFLSSYQSMKSSSSSSPLPMDTSGDYSSGYDAHTDFPIMEDDYIGQALGQYADNLEVNDNVIPSIEAPPNSSAPSHIENAPPQSYTSQHDSPAFSPSHMAPSVPPRSPMRARTPQISVSTDISHPQPAHDIESHSFQLNRQDSTPINATPSPSIAVGMWNSETMQEIHTPMHVMAHPHGNEYFSPQRLSPAPVPTMDHNLINNHAGPIWGDDGSDRQGINPDRRSQDEAPNFRDQEKNAENSRRLSIVQGWIARENETHFPIDTSAGVDDELRTSAQWHSGSNMANSPRSSSDNTSPRGARDAENRLTETPDDIDISHLRPLPAAAEAPPTVNQVKEGQVYINPNASAAIDTRDMELLTLGTGMLRLENDAPVAQAIVTTDHGGMTSSFAMEQYRKAADNFSMLSRRATWGTTRRMSDTDIEGGRRENLLKRLSIKKEAEGGDKKPGLFNRAVALARKTSQSSTANKLKRNRSDAGTSSGSPLASYQRNSSAMLVPPSPPPFERKRSRSPAPPRLETNIGDLLMPFDHPYHNRRASASNISPTSSIVGDFVRQLRSRSRSKSDANRSGGIAAQWQREGGPPVVTPSPRDGVEPASVSAQGDSDAEGDDDYEEESRGDENGDHLAPQLHLKIEPTIDGFRQNILVLNPNIKSYLVDRFAHQQSARYKGLLKKRIDHESAWQKGKCPSGSKFCLKLGGQAYPLVSRIKGRNARVVNSIDDGSDSNPENKLGPENFPAGIPMPPTNKFPAELECPYCFVVKKFQKPSDWTKHIQEDVAPFTCTWAGCKDVRSFKRKADYVRHENEKHRHIESWNCNIDDCAHVCHRKDNFQAHLVREHRMKEPTARNKADIQKACGYDALFWGIVDKCHQQSSKDAAHEPCKFCGISFSTFKKLSGHEAKHMEQISLPIIHLVEKRLVDTNTIVSPVGPPPVMQQPDTPVDIAGRSPFIQTHSSNHQSPGSEYGQYYDPNMAGFDVGYNSSHFQPSYGMGGSMEIPQQPFGMAAGPVPIPIQGHRDNTTSPKQHAHSRSYGQMSPLAQQLDQFEMGNGFQYGQDAARSMSRSYGSSINTSSPLNYPITSSPLAGFVDAPTTVAMTTAGIPANLGMSTLGGQGQYSMENNNNMLFSEVGSVVPQLARMGQAYIGAGQQPSFVQNNFGQAQFDEGMAMHRSHSDSNMMPGMHFNQQQYQTCVRPGHQYNQSVGGYPLQPQQPLQNLHPGQQAVRSRSTSGGNQGLRGGLMQQHMRPH